MSNFPRRSIRLSIVSCLPFVVLSCTYSKADDSTPLSLDGYLPEYVSAEQPILEIGDPDEEMYRGIIAENSIRIREGSIVDSDIFVLGTCGAPGDPCLTKDVELAIEKDVVAESSNIFKADSVRIRSGSVISGKVEANEIDLDAGVVVGEQAVGLGSVPVLPPFVTSEPGDQDVDEGDSPLVAGSYAALEVGKEETLELDGGIYHFTEIDADEDSTVLCRDVCTIAVAGQLRFRDGSTLEASSEDHNDLSIFVGGAQNSARVDKQVGVNANIYAPEGELRIGDDSFAKGIFIAHDVRIDRNVTIIGGTPPAPAPRLLITHFLADAETSAAEGDEFFVVKNMSDEDLVLTQDDGSETGLPMIKFGDQQISGISEGTMLFVPIQTAGEDVVLEEGESLLFAKRASDFREVFGVVPDHELRLSSTVAGVPAMRRYTPYSTTGNFGLSNSGDEILILGEDDSIVDSVAYGNGDYVVAGLDDTPSAVIDDSDQGVILERVSSGSTLQDTDNMADDFAVFVPQPPEVGQITAGLFFTCAVVNDEVQCWGYWDRFAEPPSPGTGFFVVANTKGVTKLSHGGNGHGCAIVDGGAVCWGQNGFGQLGDGTLNDSLTAAVVVDGLGPGSGVTDVEVGESSTCAIVNGGVKCWGHWDSEPLGLPSPPFYVNLALPTDVPTLPAGSGAVSISVGVRSACAVLEDQTARCWGASPWLGNSSLPTFSENATDSSPPVVVEATPGVPLFPVSQIDINFLHACAIVDGAAKCWGAGEYGQLGDGTGVEVGGINVPSSHLPVDVVGLESGVTDITTSWGKSCAVVDGGAKCWGCGLLGDGLPGEEVVGSGGSSSPIPVDVTNLGAGSGVQMVNSTHGVFENPCEDHVCVIVDGDALCWGTNFGGALGNSSITGVLSHGPNLVDGFLGAGLPNP